MDKEKKEILVGIDIFLWVITFIPGAVYDHEMIQTYRNGVSITFFDENAPVYYGWEGVKAELDLILWLGAFRFYLWLAVVVITVGYTIYMAGKLKKNNA